MNKDQLLDAIGMVDEQKIRDAVMIRRTKRISGAVAAAVTLGVLTVSVLLFGFFGWLFHDEVADYTPAQIAQDIDGANTVTVVPDPADDSTRYTVEVPHGMREAMRFEEWHPAESKALDGRESLLELRFHGLEMTFYDGGYVRARKHDWDEFVGVYAVPEGLRREVLACVIRRDMEETLASKRDELIEEYLSLPAEEREAFLYEVALPSLAEEINSHPAWRDSLTLSQEVIDQAQAFLNTCPTP